MSLEEKVGQMLMVGFDGTTANNAVRTLIEDYHVGGLVLVGRNVQSPSQVASLTQQLQTMALGSNGIPLLIAIDHEGGEVMRLTQGITVFPGNMPLGATRSPNHAYAAGQVIALELGAIGVNMNLAPVLDVNDNPANPVIGLRSFGEDPELVSELGTAYIRGTQENGIIATAKHFPGHGSTAVDSHTGLPIVAKSREELEEVELRPFRAAIESGVDAIMTAHIILTALEPAGLPATLSPRVLSGLLREEMGYDGLILTDDMEMGAITENYYLHWAAVQAVKAEVDIILVAWTFDRQQTIRKALIEAVRQGEITEERIDQSVRRILSLKVKYGLFQGPQADPSRVGTAAHQDVATEISEKAVTLVKDTKPLLPIRSNEYNKILVLSPSLLPPASQGGTMWGNAIKQRFPNSVEIVVDLYTGSRENALAQALQLGPQCDLIIVATWDAGPWQSSAIRQLQQMGKPLIVVAFGKPYDLMYFPEVDAYLAAYGRRPSLVEATAKILFGEIEPTGKLPVSIPGLIPYER